MLFRGIATTLGRRAATRAAAASAPATAASGGVSRDARRRMVHTTAVARFGGHNPGLPGTFTPPPISETHRMIAEGLMTMTFLWILYRAKEDGAVILGLRHPWEGHHGDDHGHDDHGHGDHSHSHSSMFQREEGFGVKPSTAGGDNEDDE